MEDIISQTKAELLRAKDRMVHALATTPDDRTDWSPSPTARTPLQQVAHAAMAISSIQRMLAGEPFPHAGLAELDAALRLAEKALTTRAQALGLLEGNTAGYLAWLDALTLEQLASTFHLPFGPPSPMAVGITFAAYHLGNHVAQMDYIQTIYGDHDWHF